MPADRIRIQIVLPAQSLKRFVEKALRDEDFFFSALENPLGALRESGVTVDASKFIPSDFARFFAAIDRLRAIVAGQDPAGATFEAIFGSPPVIHGAALNAETFRGFYRDWGGSDAVADRMKCFSAAQSFEQNVDRQASSVQDLCQTQEVQAQSELRAQTLFVGETDTRSETFRSQNTDWANADSVQERRSETHYNKGFSGSSIARSLQDLLGGPMIHPEDLARLAARIETFADLVKGPDAKKA